MSTSLLGMQKGLSQKGRRREKGSRMEYEHILLGGCGSEALQEEEKAALSPMSASSSVMRFSLLQREGQGGRRLGRPILDQTASGAGKKRASRARRPPWPLADER